jgi:hypothetical protein
MNEQNAFAQRVDKVDGHILIDYFILHLPVQLLSVDVIELERRSAPALTEFILRSIQAGLRREEEISGFLGINLHYCKKLLESLQSDEFVYEDPFGQYLLMRRGTELLQEGSDSRPSDKRISLLWDPIGKRLLGRTLVYTKQRADISGMFAPIPLAFLPPTVSDIDVSDINRNRENDRAPDTLNRTAEVLRVTSIHRSIGRYREALGLVFRSESGEISFRLAFDGRIDEEFTTACVNSGLLKGIGISRGQLTKASGLAVKKRFRELPFSSEQNVDAIVQRRSVLRFNLNTLDARLKEDYVDSLARKKEAYVTDLQELDAALSNLPVIPLRCHELETYLQLAFRTAATEVRITTTQPADSKIDGETLAALRDCLGRGVAVSIFISDNVQESNTMLAILDRILREKNLEVHFLKNLSRSVFEITWDNKHLVFSNEPPLGRRRFPISPREFFGYYVSDQIGTSRYTTQFLRFESSDFLSKVVATSNKKKSGSKKRTSTKPVKFT